MVLEYKTKYMGWTLEKEHLGILKEEYRSYKFVVATKNTHVFACHICGKIPHMHSPQYDLLLNSLPLLNGNTLRTAILHLFRLYAQEKNQISSADQIIDCTVTHKHGVNLHISVPNATPLLKDFIQDVPFLKRLHCSSSPYFMSGSASPKEYESLRQAAIHSGIGTTDSNILFPNHQNIEAFYAPMLQRISTSRDLESLLNIYTSHEYVGYIKQRDFGWEMPLEWSTEQLTHINTIVDAAKAWFTDDHIGISLGPMPSPDQHGTSHLFVGDGVMGDLEIPVHVYSKVMVLLRGIGNIAEHINSRSDYSVTYLPQIQLGSLNTEMQNIIDSWRITWDDKRRTELFELLSKPQLAVETALEVPL